MIDDHSRVAYVEICADETAHTAIAVLHRAAAWFAERAEGWAYARFYDSETARRTALPAWIHFYNHHRVHSATEPNHPSAD